MVNKPKARGTAFETAVVGYLRDNGFPFARRLSLSGSADQGDVSLGDIPPGGPVTIECKDHAKIDLAGFITELEKECSNTGNECGIVIIKRRGKNVSQAYVLTTLERWANDRKEMPYHGGQTSCKD